MGLVAEAMRVIYVELLERTGVLPVLQCLFGACLYLCWPRHGNPLT